MGQSGTDNPASLLVTSAPAMMSRKDPAGKNDSEPVQSAIVGCGDGFQNNASSMKKFCRGANSLCFGAEQAGQPAPSKASILSNHKIYSPAALKVWSTVLESFGATVTF